MPSLQDVLHWPQVASLLVALVAPKEAVSLVTWAIDLELHDGVRLLLKYGGHAAIDEAAVLRCAAASGCRVATLRLLSCGSLDQYVTMAAPLAPLEEIKLAFASPPLPAAAMYAAARRGDLDAVTWLHPLTKYEPHEAMAIAARHGDLQIALWIGERAMAALLDPLHPYEMDMHYLMAFEGELLALTWTAQFVNSNNQRVNRKYFATSEGSGVAPVQRVFGYVNDYAYTGAMDRVAAQGNLALLWAMHEDQAAYPWSCTSAAMDSAAAHGHLHVLEWLAENRSEGCTQAAMDSAARNGQVDVMKWLDANRDELSIKTSTFYAALEGGHVSSLQWLHKRRPIASLPESNAAEAACRSPNRLAMLQWLAENTGIRVATKTAMSLAIRDGDKPAAQWLANATAGAKNIELWNRVVAMWMSYEFELMHDDTFSEAALNGHVEIIKWLAQAGPFYKVGADVLWKCAMRGHFNVVEFILQYPTHQSDDLECLPASTKSRKPSWSSFLDAPKDENAIVSCGDWQPLAYDPIWAKPYITLWLQYRPQDCRRVTWLPEWARLCGHTEIYEQLTTLRLTARGGPPQWTRHVHSTSSGSIEKLRGELAGCESILPSLELYAQEHSDCFVPRSFVVPALSPLPTPAWGHRLGAIVSDIRARRRYALQSTRDADRLAAINFAWDVRDYKWRHVVFPALEAFASEHGHCKVPSTFVVPSMAPWPRDAWGYKLGVCVQGIRHHGLYSEQVTWDASRFSAFDFSQTSHEFEWRYIVLPALTVFADTFGHCNMAFAFVVPAESP